MMPLEREISNTQDETRNPNQLILIWLLVSEQIWSTLIAGKVSLEQNCG